ncbi:MAG: response regulator [Chloroflexi bacterium]|nr:response regulator [Chloroflexota bacterium]
MPDTKSVLLVMNEGELSRELNTLLGGMGYLVTELADVSNMREHLDSHRYDLLVMGTALPDLNWRATVTDIRNTTNVARVMMITCDAQDADLRSALSAGSYVVLERPISPTKLSDIIALRRYGMYLVVRGQSQ